MKPLVCGSCFHLSIWCTIHVIVKAMGKCNDRFVIYTLVMQRFRVHGIPWSIPRVTCIFWYTRESLGECVCQGNTIDWQVGYSIAYLSHKRALPVLFNAIENAGANPCDIRGGTMGRSGVNTVEYTMAFLESDWLCFLGYGIDKCNHNTWRYYISRQYPLYAKTFYCKIPL